MHTILNTVRTTNSKLRGKRTYLASAGFIAVGIVGWLVGAVETADAIRYILEGAGFSGLRGAIR